MSNMAAEWYEVGAHRVEITPPLTIPYLAGYPRHSYFTGVHDPLYAYATVISDGCQEVALVSIDSIGFSNGLLGPGRDFSAELKERIERESGIPRHAVMLMSGHIHSTPDTLDFRPLREIPAVLPWLEELGGQICQAVCEAAQRRFKAQLKAGTGKAEGLSFNRRGEAEVDPEVAVLLFEGLERADSVAIVHYACHPVIVQVQEQVSADFIGAMREAVERKDAGIRHCQFIQGACGDINPAIGSTRSFADVQAFGASLAREVLDICRALRSAGRESEPVRLSSLSRNLSLASRVLPPASESRLWEKEAEELERLLAKAAAGAERNRLLGELGWREEALWRIREGAAPLTAELQMVRLGNCLIAGIPGEPMCRMGLELKQRLAPLLMLPAGYTNGYVGYLAERRDWQKGGYEVDLGPWSKVGWESADYMMELLAAMGEALGIDD